jgi:uncharacterized membrane protein YdbT with pleckstrin-like domain
MPVDSRIPGITLRPEEKVVFIAKPHWVIFIRFINIFIFPLMLQFLGWKNVVYVLTNRRLIVQSGVISLAQRAVDLSKVQDVTSGVSGILARILGVGFVYVETAGQSSRVEMLAVPGPQRLCDLIQNQMALSKKEEMMELARTMKNQQ